MYLNNNFKIYNCVTANNVHYYNKYFLTITNYMIIINCSKKHQGYLELQFFLINNGCSTEALIDKNEYML